MMKKQTNKRQYSLPQKLMFDLSFKTLNQIV